MNLTFEWAVGILGGVMTAAFWRWSDKLSRNDDDLNKNIKELNDKIHQIEIAYQSKADAQIANEQITALLKEIKADLKDLTNQIHQKADKS